MDAFQIYENLLPLLFDERPFSGLYGMEVVNYVSSSVLLITVDSLSTGEVIMDFVEEIDTSWCKFIKIEVGNPPNLENKTEN